MSKNDKIISAIVLIIIAGMFAPYAGTGLLACFVSLVLSDNLD